MKPGNAEDRELERLSDAIEGSPIRSIALVSARLNSALTRQYMRLFDVTLAQFRLVMLIGRKRQIAYRDIVKAAFMDKGQVSRTLRAMIKLGLIETADGAGQAAPRTFTAVVMFRLAGRGREIFDQGHEVARGHQERLTALLDPQARAVFVATLDKLNRNIDHIVDGDEPAG